MSSRPFGRTVLLRLTRQTIRWKPALFIGPQPRRSGAGVRAYDRQVPNAEAFTSLSVRGEAQRTVTPDAACVLSTLSATSDSKSAAMSDVQATLPAILADLARLSGQALTAETMGAPLTWSTQSMRTHEEHAHDKVNGEQGPTGRHQCSVTLLVTVRDFSLLAGVAGAVTSHDAIEVHSVSWSVDQDNDEWALVRADAIRAALIKGQDYAAALGGTVVRVDHVADAGLLGGDSSGRIRMSNWGYGFAASAGGNGGDDLSIDPPPQVLSATIEARLTAVVSALPAR